ncbi:MAG: hypothetical protein K8R59_07390 [Thermoanaerobaculales bacterium]|nr:hypothetical protein [Thermoanaerobaculales bacterium]
MLHGPLTFVLLVAFAVFGSQLQRTLALRGLRIPAFDGPIWILLGVVLGGSVAGVFPEDVLAVLHAVVLMGLAWIGLVFGMQIDRTVIRRLQPWHRTIGFFLPIGVGAILAGVAFGLGLKPIMAFGLAAIGMVSSGESLDAISRSRPPADRSAARLLRMLAAFSGIPAMAVFGMASVVWCPVSIMSGGRVPGWHLLLGLTGVGVITGYALMVLIRGLSDGLQLLTVIAGITTLIAGSAAVLGISPLPAAAVAGAVVINRCVFPHRLLKAAHTIERPLLVAMLVLVGASLTGLAFSWRVFLILTVVRFVSMVSAGAVLSHSAQRQDVGLTTSFLGIGLVGQGPLALGIAVALAGILSRSPGMLEATAAAIVVNQVVAEAWLRRSLFPPTVSGGKTT